MRSSSGALSPALSSTGSRSPSPLTCGWSTERTGATTTSIGPLTLPLVELVETPGCSSRRSTASRRPTVSLRGLSRSWGSVSQLG